MRTAAALVLAMTMSTAIAADEPTSVWGLQFGEPLAAQLPQCKSSSPIQPARCFHRSPVAPTMPSLYENPNLGFSADGSALLVGDSVEGLYITLKRYEFQKAEALLVSRFGDPTKISAASYTTGGGARVTGRVLSWQWQSVRITLSEYGGRVTESVIYVTTQAYRDSQARGVRQGADSHKSNF